MATPKKSRAPPRRPAGGTVTANDELSAWVGNRPIGDTRPTELIAVKQALLKRWNLRR